MNTMGSTTPDLAAELDRLLQAQDRMRDDDVDPSDPGPDEPWIDLGRRIDQLRRALAALSPAPPGPTTTRLSLCALPDLTGALAAELDHQEPILAAHSGLVAAVPRDELYLPLTHLVGATEEDVDRLGEVFTSLLPGLRPPLTVPMTLTLTGHALEWQVSDLYEPGEMPAQHRTVHGADLLWARAVREVTDSQDSQMRVWGADRDVYALTTARCHTAGPGRDLARDLGLVEGQGQVPVEVGLRALTLAWDEGQGPDGWRAVATWEL